MCPSAAVQFYHVGRQQARQKKQGVRHAEMNHDLIETNLSSCVSGGLLDLHGTHVYLIRQILQICILCIR